MTDFASQFKPRLLNPESCLEGKGRCEAILGELLEQCRREIDIYKSKSEQTGQDWRTGPVSVQLGPVTVVVDVPKREQEVAELESQLRGYIDQLATDCVRWVLDNMP